MSKILFAALLAVLLASGASAVNFNINATFNDNATATGTFSTNAAITSITSWNFSISGSNVPSRNFSITSPTGIVYFNPTTSGCTNPSDAVQINFSTAGFTAYVVVCSLSSLTSSGITLSDGVDCNGTGSCGSLVSGSITPVANPATLSKSFGSTVAIAQGLTSNLTFTLTNPNASVALTGVAFNDPLPAQLIVANPNGLASTCSPATIVATPGSNNISVSGVTLAASASCTITVSVQGTVSGFALNSTGAITSNEAAPGLVATATVTVGNVYSVNYAANMNIGDSVINLTAAGTDGGFETAGNICANVYVFAEDQQLIACCSCPLTPNHLKTLSVRNDLISNTLTPGVPIGVTVALLASTSCNASTVTATNLSFGLKGFGTTIHAKPDGTYGVTENSFLPANLSATELAKLTSYCGFIQANGSGYGICKSCREGAAGAARQ